LRIDLAYLAHMNLESRILLLWLPQTMEGCMIAFSQIVVCFKHLYMTFI